VTPSIARRDLAAQSLAGAASSVQLLFRSVIANRAAGSKDAIRIAADVFFAAIFLAVSAIHVLVDPFGINVTLHTSYVTRHMSHTIQLPRFLIAASRRRQQQNRPRTSLRSQQVKLTLKHYLQHTPNPHHLDQSPFRAFIHFRPAATCLTAPPLEPLPRPFASLFCVRRQQSRATLTASGVVEANTLMRFTGLKA
jgi:hypothetical protein